jgi:hypothetical protein
VLSVTSIKINTGSSLDVEHARIQCRRARIQRNHIGCAVLVWIRLKNLAYQSGKTVYQIKHGMLSQYMIEQLRTPAVRMALA